MPSVVELLERLVRVDTHNPNGDEPQLARTLAAELKARGADEVTMVQVPRQPKASVWVHARWGQPTLLLNAHLDTVPPNAGWTTPPHEPRIADGKLYGLGACDVKGSIAAILAALDEARPRDLAVLFSGDEEHGGAALRAFVAAPEARGLTRAIVCEPTSLRVGARHRGVLGVEARLEGAGGHSSRADAMPAPIAELARVAVAWADWGRARREQGPEGFPGMCTNIAALDGGIAFNVVPERAKLTASVRPPPGADVAQVREELFAIARAIVPAAELCAPVENPPFATRALESFRAQLGARVDAPVDLAFWTEAAVLSRAGIDAVVLGPGDIAQAHAPDEFIAIAELETARALFADVIRSVA
jgi:acetylornithine deacetylase